jgi:hypothetical protein
MAIWLTVLKSVPWTDVISNAPLVVEGAKKLWNTVARKQPSPVTTDIESSAEEPSVAEFRARVDAAEVAITDLHNQMLASSELIKALADQNARLIERIEANRVRVRWLIGFFFIMAVVVLFGLIKLLAH